MCLSATLCARRALEVSLINDCCTSPFSLPLAGLTLHSQPRAALPIMIAIIATHGGCLTVAAFLRPFISPFLNFLEVLCGAIDMATLTLVALAYARQLQLTGEDLPAQPDGFIKVWQAARASGCDYSP